MGRKTKFDKHPTNLAIVQILIKVLVEQQLSIKKILAMLSLKDR